MHQIPKGEKSDAQDRYGPDRRAQGQFRRYDRHAWRSASVSGRRRSVEGVNRAVFRFNDTVDTYTLKPLARGYQKVTPGFLEDGIGNVFSNLGDVVVLTNDLLQGKVRDAGIDTSRILFNTTFGVLGFFDVATRMGLHKNDEDFGQTLGARGWEVGHMSCCRCLGQARCVMPSAGCRIPSSNRIRTWIMCRPAT